MRRIVLLVCFVASVISCADGYIHHDYPIYAPEITPEQAQWISFGFNDSLAFIDTAGSRKTVVITRRDTTADLDWNGAPVYKTLELNGTNYNYTSRNYYTEFNIDTLFCTLSVSIDSAQLFQQSGLTVQISIDGKYFFAAGPAANVSTSSVSIASKSYNTFLYVNPNIYEPIKEVAISPEFGILWIKFYSEEEWRNSVLLR